MVIVQRLADRMKEAGISQAELSRRVGVSQQAISKLVSGDSAGSRYLHVIARVLNTTVDYLTGLTDDPALGAVPEPTPQVIAEHLDLVPIATIDQDYGLGMTFMQEHVETDIRHFPRAWIESFTATPSNFLTFARGRGDSMQPTIHSNDMVLIDRSQKKIGEDDAIWAYSIGEIGGIKRLRVRGNRVTLLSDNPSVPSDEALVDEIAIVGRVIMIIRNI